MKRIEFIAPVNAMRGNLGETQRDIVYPTHDNSAYDGPVGERNTARNYNPIIVGAIRANGRAYFCVRTKTTNHLTPLAKKSMATMGATCAVYAAMKKDASIAAKMDEVFTFMIPSLPAGATPRSYFMERITLALSNKDALIDLSAGSIEFKVINPWAYKGESEGAFTINVKAEIVVKFWDELAIDPITFKVGTVTGVAHTNDTFATLIQRHYNVLNLTTETITTPYEGEVVKLGEMYLHNSDGEIQTEANQRIEDKNVFVLSETIGEQGG